MMIPRTLVPEKCAAPTGAPARPPKRLKTWLDNRTLVSQEMPVVPFGDLSSNIPSYVPLAVIDNRVLISRDMPIVPFPPELAKSEPTLTDLDGRVVVPPEAHFDPAIVEPEPFSAAVLQDLVESDLLVGGEARLLPEKARRVNWDFLGPVFSVAFHVLLIVLFLTLPGLLGRYTVTPAQEAMNQQNLGYVYLPKDLEKIPKRVPEPRQKPSDKMKIDVGELNKIAPPKPEVSRQQGPSPRPEQQVTPPKPPPQQMAEAAPQPKPEPPPPKPEPHLEPITPKNNHPIIAAPDMSPGRAIEQSLRAAAQQAQTPSIGFSDRIPAPPAMPGGPGQEGGPGPGYLSGSIQILTPTDGVDFTSYIARLLAIVKRNWYAVMPESARLGDRGRVMLRFKIMRDGSLPNGEPILEMTSGKRPLDRAAEAAITASNPFDPLPTAYTRPYIELRFMFLYNIPLNTQ